MLKKLFNRALISIFIGLGITAALQNLTSLAAGIASGGNPAFFGALPFIKLTLFYSLIPFLILTIISLFSKNKT